MKHTCHYCNYTTTKNTNFKKHLASKNHKNQVDAMPHSCTYCNFTTHRLDKYNEHCNTEKHSENELLYKMYEAIGEYNGYDCTHLHYKYLNKLT